MPAGAPLPDRRAAVAEALRREAALLRPALAGHARRARDAQQRRLLEDLAERRPWLLELAAGLIDGSAPSLPPGVIRRDLVVALAREAASLRRVLPRLTAAGAVRAEAGQSRLAALAEAARWLDGPWLGPAVQPPAVQPPAVQPPAVQPP